MRQRYSIKFQFFLSRFFVRDHQLKDNQFIDSFASRSEVVREVKRLKIEECREQQKGQMK